MLRALVLSLLFATPTFAQDPEVQPPPPGEGEGDPGEGVQLENDGDAPPSEPLEAVDPDAVGVMVRLTVAEGEPDPTAITLTAADGTTHTIPVRDDGTNGDVDAGDRTWAGSKWLAGETFDVTIATSDGPLEAGQISWAPGDEPRDLLVTVDATQVTAQALVSKPLATGTPEPGPTSAGSDPGGASPTPPPGGGNALGTGSTASSDSGSNPLRIAGLVFGLLALGAVFWWWRQSSGGRGAADVGEPLPEPGLLGPATPAIGNGVTVWSVSKEDAPHLIGPLLGAVARSRVVVVSAPSTFAVPPVYGGPVYAADSIDDVGDALEDLGRGAGFWVVEKPSVETLAEAEATRPNGTGIVILGIDAPALDGAVTCTRNGQRWRLSRGDAEVVVRAGPYGLVHPDAVDDDE